MSRNRPRTASWTEEDLAMDYVKTEGCSLRSASIKFNITYNTFKERMKKCKTVKRRTGNEETGNGSPYLLLNKKGI